MRALMGAVIAMGVLIVAGVITLATLVIHRAGLPAASPTALPATLAASRPAITLAEPAGTRIAGTTALGPDRLALQLSGGGPDRVLIIDLPTGRQAARITLELPPSLP